MSSASNRNCESTSHFPNLDPESVRPSPIAKFRRLSLLILAIASLSVYANPSQTLAEPPPAQQVADTPQAANAPASVIYVSPSAGDDTGDGSQQSPLKTITQALSLAQPNTAIILGPGTYSAQTGEQFPLMLPPNVTLQGNPNTRGEGIVIYGGGFYTSRTFAKQDIAVLGANGARISGVTVTNPNPRGYGLWVESASMIVSNNTFTGNTHDGISIVGTSAPLVQENNFNQNGANGVTVYGYSRPEIRNNEFQNTGFAINISQNAAPFIAGNRITFNKDGIVIQADARPILRDNYIERNERDGIVAIARALPDLGNAGEPGQNVIRSNGRYDVNNGTQTQVIEAYGNQLAPTKIAGSVRVNGNYSAPDAPSPIAQQLASGLANNSAESQTASNNPSAISPVNASAALPVYVPEAAPPPRTARNTRQEASPRPVAIAVPPPETQPISRRPPATRRSERRPNPSPRPMILSSLSSAPTNESAAIPIPVPPPETGQVLNPYPPQTSQPPALSSGVLPVPGSRIPISGEGYTPPGLNVGPSASPPVAQLTPLTATLRGSLQYRVVIEDNSERAYQQVRRVVPDAFRTVVAGRSIIQAGAFQSRYKADEVIQLLNRNGIRAKLESYN